MADDLQPQKTDIPIHSPYKDIPVNGIVPLYSGPIHLTTDQGEATEDGSIQLSLQGEPQVTFDVAYNENLGLNFMDGNLNIPSPSHCTPSPFWALQTNISMLEGTGSIRGILKDGGLTLRKLTPEGKQASVGRIKFHLINFRRYHGTSLSEGNASTTHDWSGRVTFTFGQWTVTLDQFRDIDLRLKEAKAVHGYIFTHVGILHRSDNKLFLPDTADAAFDVLHWFLSFVNGAHCGCVMNAGFRHLDHPLWERWQIPIISPVHLGKNWFTTQPTLPCFAVADKFYACWSDPDKREWFRSAMGMYLACNQFHGGIELTLANSQIAIEMLTWIALQEENSLMSEEGFEKLSAGDKMRSLLFWVGVSTSIPASLQQLKAAFPTHDAPDAVVKIRNLTIHATKANRAQRALIPNEAIRNAWHFNMWVAELTILKLIGYSGAYNNRLGNKPMHVWELLPWTDKTSLS